MNIKSKHIIKKTCKCKSKANTNVPISNTASSTAKLKATLRAMVKGTRYEHSQAANGSN